MALSACPTRYITEATEAMIQAYERYLDGYLPVAGGLEDQSQCFNEALPWMKRLWSFHEALTNDPEMRKSIEEGKAR